MAVFQLKDGSWGYRVLVKDSDGVARNRRATRDALGNKFKTKRAATTAMNEVIRKFSEPAVAEGKDSDITIKELYEEYCKYGRSDKAFATNRKHDSLWNIHLNNDFGERSIKDITVAEVNDYLSELYYGAGYAYKYVESFIKFFYLLFGQAYSREYLSVEKYNKLCVDKGTKIHMPKLKIDEDLDIKAFDRDQMRRLDDYFRGSNVETAYLLGKYCGLRMGECMGLTWDCVDFENDVIRIEKQMQIQEGLIKIVPLKTRNAKREIVMSSALKEFLLNRYKQRELDKETYKEVREQREILLKTSSGLVVSSLDLVNTSSNGKLQTEMAFRFHSKNIRAKLGIDFKYHYLRHTFGTMMALLNVPQYLLCNQMGHGNINVTSKYYLGETKDGVKLLRDSVNSL